MLLGIENTDPHPQRLDRGVYGLSNGGLDAPWPKVDSLKAGLQASLDAARSVDVLATQLFGALADRRLAADHALPRTGISIDLERQLSAAFIGTPDQRYGTRCSTLIITEKTARQPITHVHERTFDAAGAVVSLRRARLRNWPPRYVGDDGHGPVEQPVVSEHEVATA